jgi:hypothetical protein
MVSSLMLVKLEIATLIMYCQTFVQRPPLGPPKSGRCAEVAAIQSERERERENGKLVMLIIRDKEREKERWDGKNVDL